MECEHIERLGFPGEAPCVAEEVLIHAARYLLAKGFCAGRSVLDVSCGEGYGSYLMAAEWGALEVDAVDISEEALARARAIFMHPRIRWHQLDAARLLERFEPHSFDLIVSLETLEHLEDPEGFIRSLHALLRPRGVLVLSCPNDHWYYRDGVGSNPYHLHRFHFEEFQALVERAVGPGCSFHLGLPIKGFGTFPVAEAARPARTMVEGMTQPVRGLVEPLMLRPETAIEPAVSSYFVAIYAPEGDGPSVTACLGPISMTESDLPRAQQRVADRLVEERDRYIRELEARIDQQGTAIRHLDGMVEERDRYIRKLEGRVDEQGTAIRHLDGMVEERDRYIRELEGRVDALQGEQGTPARLPAPRTAPAKEQPVGSARSGAGIERPEEGGTPWAGPRPAVVKIPASGHRFDVSLLDGAEALFCDLFDTVILRSVLPENTKRLAAKRLAAVIDPTLDAERIYALRARLEQEACSATEAAGGDLDFRFDATFAARVQAVLGGSSSRVASLPAKTFAELLADVELDAELAVQSIDSDVVAFISEARRRGLTVFAVSDFYWPEELLRRALRHHGVEALFDRVIVSSEYRITRRTGRLYDIALEALGGGPRHVLMLGDNEVADVERACEKGLRALLLDRTAQRARYEEERRLERRDSVQGLIRTALSADAAGSFFSEFPLTLLAFIDKLYAQLRRDGVRDVLFLSREGEFLKRCFDLYQEIHRFGDASRVRSHYLMVSRCSTFIPSLRPLESETFDTLFRQYGALSLRDFLSNLNFTADAIHELAQLLGVDADHRESDFPRSALFAILRATPRFRERYESLRLEQRRLLKRYLASLVPDCEARGLAIVDVGWKGTIQDHLHRLYDGEVPIFGYYLGLVSEGAATPTNRKLGLLFSLLNGGTPFAEVYNDNRSVFEILLGASHGSASRYIELPDGTVQVALRERQEESHIFDTVVAPLQARYQVAFEALAALFARTHLTIEQFEEFIARTHARFTFLPTQTEMDFFTELHHFENFGAFGTSRFERPSGMGLPTRIRNLVGVLKRPQRLAEVSMWPALSLEQLGLGELRPLYGRMRFERTFLRSRR